MVYNGLNRMEQRRPIPRKCHLWFTHDVPLVAQIYYSCSSRFTDINKLIIIMHMVKAIWRRYQYQRCLHHQSSQVWTHRDSRRTFQRKSRCIVQWLCMTSAIFRALYCSLWICWWINYIVENNFLMLMLIFLLRLKLSRAAHFDWLTEGET